MVLMPSLGAGSEGVAAPSRWNLGKSKRIRLAILVSLKQKVLTAAAVSPLSRETSFPFISCLRHRSCSSLPHTWPTLKVIIRSKNLIFIDLLTRRPLHLEWVLIITGSAALSSLRRQSFVKQKHSCRQVTLNLITLVLLSFSYHGTHSL